VAHRANPADESRTISDPDIATLVNEVLASTKEPVGTTHSLFRRERQALTPLAFRERTASLDRSKSSAPEVTTFETAVIVVGVVAVILAGILFFFELSP
jgi:hypothetical protein